MKWESKLEEMTTSKVKLDMELVGLNADATVTKKLDEDFEAIAIGVKERLSDLTNADKERGLFALNKQVKDVAAYPESFQGKGGENIYKFFVKMKKALESNQVSENERVDVLIKHLGGSAKGLVTDSQTLLGAEMTLKARYGSARNIWDGSLEKFKKVCNNPKAWSAYGTEARCDVISKTITFLNEARQLAEEFHELESVIYHETTVGVFNAVLPREIITKAQDLELDPKAKVDTKRTLDNIKLRLELDQRNSLQDTAHLREIEENKKSFSVQFNNFKEAKEKPKTPRKKKYSP